MKARPVILSGGSGVRLWPISRKNLAKQFIDFGVSHIPKSNNPLEPKFSLIQFKEQFGAAGVQRTAYYKEL